MGKKRVAETFRWIKVTWRQALSALLVVGCATAHPMFHLDNLTEPEAIKVFAWLATLRDLSDVTKVSGGLSLTPHFDPGERVFIRDQLVVSYFIVFRDMSIAPGSPHKINYNARNPKTVFPNYNQTYPEYPGITSYRGEIDFSLDASSLCVKRKQLEAIWGPGRLFSLFVPRQTASSQLSSEVHSPEIIQEADQDFSRYAWDLDVLNVGNNTSVNITIYRGCVHTIVFSQSDPSNR